VEPLEGRCLLSAGFEQVNLAWDLPDLARVTDPNIVNPWGISFKPTGPFWRADNGTAVSSLSEGQGAPVVTIATAQLNGLTMSSLAGENAANAQAPVNAGPPQAITQDPWTPLSAFVNLGTEQNGQGEPVPVTLSANGAADTITSAAADSRDPEPATIECTEVCTRDEPIECRALVVRLDALLAAVGVAAILRWMYRPRRRPRDPSARR
jgi:hypothetical protein